MKTYQEIKDQITLENEIKSTVAEQFSLHGLPKNKLNEPVCCEIGNILSANGMETKVTNLFFDLCTTLVKVVCDNGQRISMDMLNDFVAKGQITVK